MPGDAQRGQRCDRASPLQRVVDTAQSVNRSRRVQACTVEHLGGQQHRASDRPAELASQPFDRPLVDHQPKLRRRNRELALGRRYPEIAHRRQLSASAHRRAIDGCDDGCIERRESVQHAPQIGDEHALLDTGQVGTRREGGRGTGQHDDPGIAARGLCVEQPEQGCMIDRIAPIGTIEGDDDHSGSDVVTAFNPYHGGHCMTVPHASNDPADEPVDDSRGDETVQDDPIRARRARVAKWTLLANRVGYLVLALAMSLFVLAFVFGFNTAMATAIVTTMLISFALLAPSIVLGYAVKAADRDDADRGF